MNLNELTNLKDGMNFDQYNNILRRDLAERLTDDERAQLARRLEALEKKEESGDDMGYDSLSEYDELLMLTSMLK